MEEKNVFAQGFLLRNGFKQLKPNVYSNFSCVIEVMDDSYEIRYCMDEEETIEQQLFVDSWSIPHLLGTLLWNHLIRKEWSR